MSDLGKKNRSNVNAGVNPKGYCACLCSCTNMSVKLHYKTNAPTSLTISLISPTDFGP